MHRLSGFMSVVGLALIFGCGTNAPKPATAPNPPAKSGEKQEHSHGAGPHGGAVADWGGGKYHVEFKVDHDKKEATIYVAGSDEKTPAPIKVEKLRLSIDKPAFEVDLLAKPQDGDPAGSASRFVGTHENLGKVQEFAGEISGVVDDVPYTGKFAETPEM